MGPSSQVSCITTGSSVEYSFRIHDKSSEAQQFANELQSIVSTTFGMMTHRDAKGQNVRSVSIRREVNSIYLSHSAGKSNATASAIFRHLITTVPRDNPTITQIERACVSFRI